MVVGGCLMVVYGGLLVVCDRLLGRLLVVCGCLMVVCDRSGSFEMVCGHLWSLPVLQISLENTCAGYNVNVKAWFYAFSLVLNLKKLLHKVVFQ